MSYKVYLSGEIHTNWRIEIIKLSKAHGLDVEFTSPELNHAYSDSCGTQILGDEEKKLWADQKSAKINLIRSRKNISESDIVVVRFGDKYKQWNAAFDAGYSVALNKSLIVMHNELNQHALKEVDAMAVAVVENSIQVVKILRYLIRGEL